MYNVIEALRAGRALTAKELAVHDAGLVSVLRLRQLHDEIITRLVALNATRAAEGAAGTIRWLHPEYQTRNAE